MAWGIGVVGCIAAGAANQPGFAEVACRPGPDFAAQLLGGLTQLLQEQLTFQTGHVGRH